jgi:TetR/AcrR family transcriptional repressor of nem operon
VHFEDFRRRLEAVFLEWEAILAACLERGKQDGSVSVEIDAKQAAAFFWTGWEGAVMRAKITVATRPMEDFGATFIRWIQADQGGSGALRGVD